MPIFKPISEKEATGKVKEIYDDIKNKRQITEIPNFWKTMANSPETLERTWNSLKNNGIIHQMPTRKKLGVCVINMDCILL